MTMEPMTDSEKLDTLRAMLTREVQKREAAEADNERLRAALAEAWPVVEEVARIDECGSRFNPLVPYDAQVSLLTITRARKLLASEKASDEHD